MSDPVLTADLKVRMRMATHRRWVGLRRRKERDETIQRAQKAHAERDAETARLLLPGLPQSIDIATLMMLLKLAIDLWLYWQSKQILLPSVVPSSLEPIDWETDQ